MTKTQSILAAIRERASKATAGPWEANPNDDCQLGEEKDGHVAIKTIEDDPWHIARVWESGPTPLRDANFIAHARTDVPRLVAALERALSWIGDYNAPISGEEVEREIERILSGESL